MSDSSSLRIARVRGGSRQLLLLARSAHGGVVPALEQPAVDRGR